MNDYLQLPIEEKIIFIWIKHLYFEFMEHKHCQGYKFMINKFISPMISLVTHKNYDKIRPLCIEATQDMKILNGNHYHMNLFIELEKMLKKIIE